MNTLDRRNFLLTTAAGFATGCLTATKRNRTRFQSHQYQEQFNQPAFSITPVVSDGKWIWGEPPAEKGYLEPREFEVSVGMEFTGTGTGKNLKGTTVAPVQFPEQKIIDFKIVKQGCSAEVASLTDSASQLVLFADQIETGQSVSAQAVYRIKNFKSYMGFEKDQFPADQPRIKQAPKQYLKSSPGIKTLPVVKQLASSIAGSSDHPWDKAFSFYEWVWDNITGIPGKYTSVESAIKNRKGDCEERACTFIALCRAAGIPSRQVWVPSHVWAEIALHDHDGVWHWLPVHTAAYNWFGWTGAHEIVLQKGDRIHIPDRNRRLRLVDDWYQIKGARPKMKFTASIIPVAGEGQDPGPGGRQKISSGEWKLTDGHPANRYLRDG